MHGWSRPVCDCKMFFHLLFKNIRYLFISRNGNFIIFLFTESEKDTTQIVETNETDDKASSAEQLNDKLAEEAEKEAAENISTTEDSISKSISAEQSEESLTKTE